MKTYWGGSQYIETKVARIICNNAEAAPHRKDRFFKVGTQCNILLIMIFKMGFLFFIFFCELLLDVM